MEDLSVQIEQYEEIGEHIDYARFFIASTLNELGDKSAFDSLVEKNKLGVLINLGITHVTDDSGLLSTTVDKHLKKFNKKVRSNHDMSNYISKLYEESTGSLRTNLQIQ